ncbi:hypothetical protein AWZ03_012762 [Drosophila navojoa]|uniref:Uncharacterized protein n=1 Tax=Drosophila navojoa TaxID=7232 RepID=A0A484AVY7_DRONA|nr:hypothetical protein AWZ03_012762 [Drosophila navojoa]
MMATRCDTKDKQNELGGRHKYSTEIESRGPEAFRATRQGNIGSTRSEGRLIASVVSLGFRLWFLVSRSWSPQRCQLL